VHSVSIILDEKYTDHWFRIKQLTGEGAEHLISDIENYINILSISQHDTYTNPFEIVAPNMGKSLQQCSQHKPKIA
jgi:cadherin EGF LAG seven-pass G-type receptor 1